MSFKQNLMLKQKLLEKENSNINFTLKYGVHNGLKVN